jgi:hypothetical protein
MDNDASANFRNLTDAAALLTGWFSQTGNAEQARRNPVFGMAERAT